MTVGTVPQENRSDMMGYAPCLADQLDRDQHAALLRAGGPRRYAEEEPLVIEGSVAADVLLLRSGRVKVVSVDHNGNEVILAVRGPGDLVGEAGVLTSRPRQASVVALEEVTALRIPASQFQHLVWERPAVAALLTRMLISRLHQSDQQRVRLGTSAATARVAHWLLDTAARYGHPDSKLPGMDIGLALSQQDIGRTVGASREATARAFTRLRTARAVATRRLQVVILDEDLLRRFAESSA